MMRVVKLGGSSIDESLEPFGRFLAGGPGPVVVVHGGGPQVSALARRLSLPTRQIAGRRVTDEATLEVVLMALGGALHNRIVASLIAAGAPVVGVAGPSVLRARRRPALEIEGETVDFGWVGEIVRTETALVQDLLRQGKVPVIPCIASSERGDIFNINADTAAAALAVELRAKELIQVTDSGGVRSIGRDPSSRIERLGSKEARRLLANGVAAAGMRPKLEAALAALDSGVPLVRIAGAGDLENAGGGTLLSTAFS